MLKQLRKRFVFIATAIMSILIVSFCLLFSSVFLLVSSNDMNVLMQKYTSSDDFNDNSEIADKIDEHSLVKMYASSIFVVDVSYDGTVKILNSNPNVINKDILYNAINYTLESHFDFGNLPDYNLFFQKTQKNYGYRIAFADSTQFYFYAKSLMLFGLIVAIVSVMFVFLIMRFLAKLSVKPVEKAWIQQRDFIADASHELKTPLTVILTNIGILKSHKDDYINNQMKWVESTYEEANHMKDLVDKLLLLAKTDNANQKTVFSNVNLSELAMKVALQYEPVAFENGVILNSQIEDDININGDCVALNQILHILLDNAIKYSDPNKTVELSLKKRQTHSFRNKTGFVYLSTLNFGPVIPEEEIPHLFDRFYRADKARTSGNGYGLGLTICKNLCELHNAEIFVSSDILNGTRFTVKFKIDQ